MGYPYDEPCCNASSNPRLEDWLGAASLTRRQALQGGLSVALTALFGCAGTVPRSGSAGPLLGFPGIPAHTEDALRVPVGYMAQVLYAWGDPVSAGPAFRPDAGNSAEEQALQAGMHHDGLHFFPFRDGAGGWVGDAGLLVVNHEYTDDGLLHPDGMASWNAEKVRKSQAAHGVSVIEVRRRGNRWEVVRPSRYARRITAASPMRLSGPASGDALLKTAADPSGLSVLGTLNNCANGFTPWGTYLTCEENWNGYFVNRSGAIPEAQRRYGISAKGAGYRWHEFDLRFDAATQPNEPHRFGWVVEIDPFDPGSAPVKRTALGRIKHEGAMAVLAADGRVVVYMGDDERFEYIYKFVSRDRYDPTLPRKDLLDHGILYVARFEPTGAGRWIPLIHGANGLIAGHGFASQAEVLVKTRQAADRVGATPMDRPEWIAVHPQSRDVYCTLTNNSQRGAAGKPGADPANSRPGNVYGHILRWSEQNADAAATAFRWEAFLLCGDPEHADQNKRGSLRGDLFGSPDGLWFDARGVLWIQTDVSTSALNKGDYARFGNNQMLACDPASGEARRFLTGPRGCEVTGVTASPDGRTLFVNIQHPGETAGERSDPAAPQAISAWPDGPAGGRPRSATVAIFRSDGGAVGA